MKTLLLTCCLLTGVGLVACDRRDDQPADPSETTDTQVAPGTATGTDPAATRDQAARAAGQYGGGVQGSGTTTAAATPQAHDPAATGGGAGTPGSGTAATGDHSPVDPAGMEASTEDDGGDAADDGVTIPPTR